MGMQLLQQGNDGTMTPQTSLLSYSSIGSSYSSSQSSSLNVSSRSASPQERSSIIILESKAALSFELERVGVEAEIKRIKDDIAKMDVMPVPNAEGRSRLEDELKAAEDKLAELQLQIAVEQGMARAKAMADGDCCTQTVTTAAGSTIAGDNISLYSKSSRARNNRRGGGHHKRGGGHGGEDYETGSVASRHSITSKSIAGSVAYTIDSRYREQMTVKSNMSVEEFRFNMDREHAQNNDLMKKLAKKMAKHITKSSERKALKSHWEYKSTRLHMQCMRFERNRAKQMEAIQELEDYKRIQQERIASLQQGVACKLFTGASPFAKRATLDPSFVASLERVVNTSRDVWEQIREEAKIELLALEEYMAIDNESLGPKKELVAIKAILDFTDEELDGNHVVYYLSCMGCNEQMGFVGITEVDLKTSIDKHLEQIVKAVGVSSGKSKFAMFKKKSSVKSTPAPAAPALKPEAAAAPAPKKSKSNGPDRREAWSKDFAAHVSRHCKPKSKFKSVTEEEVLQYCRENVKVEVLQRKYGAQLHWEDQSKDVLS